MSSANEYRRRAQMFLRLSEMAEDPAIRAALVKRAADLHDLALAADDAQFPAGKDRSERQEQA